MKKTRCKYRDERGSQCNERERIDEFYFVWMDHNKIWWELQSNGKKYWSKLDL